MPRQAIYYVVKRRLAERRAEAEQLGEPAVAALRHLGPIEPV